MIDQQRSGELLRQLMKKHNVSVSELQEYLCLACPQSVYKWLNGYAIPKVEHLLAMGRLFHIRMDKMLFIQNLTCNETICELFSLNEGALRDRMIAVTNLLTV